MKSRRRFLKLIAAGSAAALAGPAVTLRGAAAAAAAARVKAGVAAKPGVAAPGHAALPTTGDLGVEIARQKKSLADALKTLREYPLPAGSPMGFVFAPIKAARRKPR